MSSFIVSTDSLNFSAISRSVDMLRCGGGMGGWVMSSLCSWPPFKESLVGLIGWSGHDSRIVMNATRSDAPKVYHWLTIPCVFP